MRSLRKQLRKTSKVRCWWRLLNRKDAVGFELLHGYCAYFSSAESQKTLSFWSMPKLRWGRISASSMTTGAFWHIRYAHLPKNAVKKLGLEKGIVSTIFLRLRFMEIIFRYICTPKFGV